MAVINRCKLHSAAKLLAGASLAALSAGPAAGQTGRNEQVIVTGTRANSDITSLTKLPEPIIDTPQTVGVVGSEELAQRGTANLNDALRNLPGISLGAGEFSWQGNNPTIRGFLARNDMYIDGVRDFGSYYRDTFDYEAIEVLSGPSSVYFGRGSTGGVINQVSKMPFLEERGAAQLSAGTDDTERATLDYNMPLAEEGDAVRLNAMAHFSRQAGRDVGTQRRWGLAPSLALGLGTPTRLAASYLHESANDTPDYGIPWYFGRPAPVKYSNFYGYDSDYLKTEVNVLTLKAEHDFSDDVTLRNTLRLGQYGRDFRVSEGVLAPGTTLSTPLSAVQVARNIWQGKSTETLAYDQVELSAQFDALGFPNKLVAGTELAWENSKPLFQNTTGVPSESLVAPTPHVPFPGSVFQRLYSTTPGETMALYGVDTVTLDPRWEITLGVRWDQFASDFNSITYATVPNVPQAAPSFLSPPVSAQVKNVDPFVTYRAGLVYKVTENGRVYFAHGTSFDPSAESLSQLTSGRALLTQNAFLPPERNQSFELGSKWQFMSGNIEASAALFRLQKDNARIPSSVPGVNILGGSQQVDGFELSLAGELMQDWHVQAGYSYLDSHTTATAAGASLPGSPLVNTPKDAVSFWTEYRILPEWSVNLGGQYVSQRLGQNTAASYLTSPPYFTMDAGSEYRLGPRYAIRLNLYNLTDRNYIDEIHPFRAVPGAGRSALLTLEIDTP
ncbi:MAG TPA: TonB-dependent siderophore receptor [Rhizomicrobium sp.]|nr:TonB-dependent siderophore receptor [Rhizomicrobium sp.]